MVMNSCSTLLKNNHIKYILEYLRINIDNKNIQHQKKDKSPNKYLTQITTKKITSYSTLLTNNQEEVRITKHKNTHKIYTTKKYISKILKKIPNEQLINKALNNKKIILK
jgi:hypothetical protein